MEKRYQLNKSKSNSNLAYDQPVIKYGWAPLESFVAQSHMTRGNLKISFLSPEIPNQGIFDQLANC